MKCPLQGKPFYCREWVFGKLIHYLEAKANAADAAKVPGVLVVGGPGTGKTAVCAELAWPQKERSRQAELNEHLLAYHFCQRSNASSLDPSSFITSIADQLTKSNLIPDFAQRVREDASIQRWLDPGRTRQYPIEALQHAVLSPLSRCLPPQEPLIILIDSLHESIEHRSAQIGEKSDSKPVDNVGLIEVVSHAAKHLPSWILLVCTARKACRRVNQQLAGFKKVTLDDLRRSCVVHDVQQYILSRLDSDDTLRHQLDTETADMLNQLHIKSAGCLLYLELVLDGVRQGFIRLREIQHMPGTLNGFFLWLCQRLFPRTQIFAKVRPILEVLLASPRALTKEDLLEIMRCKWPTMTNGEFGDLLVNLGQLLLHTNLSNEAECKTDSSRTHLLIFHPSFIEWLLDVKYCTRKYLCDTSEGHEALALWYSSRGPKLNQEEIIAFAHSLTRAPSRPPFTSFSLSTLMVESGAHVQDIVLKCPVTDDQTTRLLLEAGADFASISAGSLPETASEGEPGSEESTDRTNSSPHSEGSENEVLIDESQLDSEGRTALHLFSVEGKDTAVQQLLDRGAYVDAEDRHGDTPLCLVSKHGHIAVIQLLLDAGADPNHLGSEGWSPLRSAAWSGQIEIVDLLLKAGAQVDFAGPDQRTPLRAAAWGGHEDVVCKLLGAGAQVNAADQEGRTALMAAAYMGHRHIVELLIAAGADPNHADKDGRTALSVSAVCASQNADHMGVAESLLLGRANADCQDANGRTPLFYAALEGHTDMCNFLIDHNADIDLPDSMQNTPLLAAASCGYAGVVATLLARNAYAEAIDSEGRTVLSISAAQGDPQVLEELISRGLDEMHRDNNGWIPLHHAAFEGHSDACRLLCQYNQSTVKQTDREGRHPLILAAEEGHTEALRVLLDFGGPANKPNLEGRTALRSAAIHGHMEACQLLVSRGADVETKDIDGLTPLYSHILERQTEMAEMFLRFGARVDARDAHGRTPLHVASWLGSQPSVELLLKFGAEIDCRDQDGRTPLMTALWRSHLELVQFLIQRKANVNAATSEGATALSIAAQEGSEEAVKLLLRAGADATRKDQYGRSAEDVAKRSGRDRIVQLLQKQSTLSPLSPRKRNQVSPASNTGGGSQNSGDKTSGFVSLIGSTESPYSTEKQRARCFVNHSFGTNSSSRSKYTESSSTKSTLSSCETPEDSFARQLLERSLPRPHSRPVSMRLTASDIPLSIETSPRQDSRKARREPPLLVFPSPPKNDASPSEILQCIQPTYSDRRLQSEKPLTPSSESGQSFVRIGSVPATNRRRPGIATNPKYRQKSNSSSHSNSKVSYSSLNANDRTKQNLRETAARLENLMRTHSCDSERVSVL